MPRNVTVTFDDGSSHVYQNAPDDITPDQIAQRATSEFGKKIAHLDGGRQQVAPEQIQAEAMVNYADLRDKAMREQYASLSPIEKLTIGIGKAGEDIGQATKQIGLYLASKMATPYGATGIIENELKKAQASAAESERAYQMGTPDGTIAGAGRILGNVATTAIPGSLATKAMTFKNVASPLLRTALSGGGGGAVSGLLTPVTNEGDFLSEKAKQVGIGTAAGAIISPVIQTLGRLATFNSPTKMLNEEIEAAARKAQQQTVSPNQTDMRGAVLSAFENQPAQTVADDVAALQSRTGVKLTPGMATDSRALKIAEQAFRQNIVTADKAYAIDDRIIGQTTNYLNKVMDAVARKPETAETAGAAVQNAVTGAVKKMVNERTKAAAPLYQAIDKSGVKIKYDNLAKELQTIIDEHAGAIDDTSQSIVNNAKRKLAEISKPALDEAGNPIEGQFVTLSAPASSVAKTRSGFSAQTAAGDLFKDIDKANNRRLAARLTDAVQRDLESEDSVSPLLKEANSLWRKHTARIKQAESTILGKVVGKDLANEIDDLNINQVAPEKVFDKLKNLKPSEARFVRAFLDKHNPDAAQKMKRAMLQDAYDSMFTTAASVGADGRPQLGKFVDFVNKNKSLGKWYTDEEMKMISDGVQIIKRVGDKFGYNNSFTAGQTFFNELLTNPIKSTKDIVAAVAGAKQMEKALNAGTYLSNKPANAIPVSSIAGSAIGQAGAKETQDERR